MEEDLEYYLEIGAITIEGVDEHGEFIFAIHEKSKDIAPELWAAHMKYVDDSLIELYEQGLVEIEYDENLEAMISLSPEGYQIAVEKGILPFDMPDAPND